MKIKGDEKICRRPTRRRQLAELQKEFDELGKQLAALKK